jgi:hypothetical protein
MVEFRRADSVRPLLIRRSQVETRRASGWPDGTEDHRPVLSVSSSDTCHQGASCSDRVGSYQRADDQLTRRRASTRRPQRLLRTGERWLGITGVVGRALPWYCYSR